MKQRFLTFALLSISILGMSNSLRAISFDLDSIAEKGKFANFCIKTYRWGDKTFNTYNPEYVEGTGRKFNVKLKSDSWLDYYEFTTPNDTQIKMTSNPTSSFGVSVSYLAVSVGYDINLSKLLNGRNESRKKFNFQFVCALLAADLYYSDNNLSTNIKKFGNNSSPSNLNIPFNGVKNSSLGIDAYYFFNNAKYSQAAAYSYSRIQKKSAGSFFAGISMQLQEIDIDFSELPNELKQKLPSISLSDSYNLSSRNFCIIAGYGYNWVFAPKWLFNISVAPLLGYRYGKVNTLDPKYGFSFNARNKFSVVYNNSSKRIFAALVGRQDWSVYANSEQTFLNSLLSLNACIGYRF